MNSLPKTPFPEIENYKSNLDILMNILLARERSFNDPNLKKFANELISLPSRVMELVAINLLPKDDLRIPEFRKWHAIKHMEFLNSKMERIQECISTERCNETLEDLQAQKNVLWQEIRDHLPIFNVANIRNKIEEYKQELDKDDEDMSYLAKINRERWLNSDIERFKNQLNTDANKQINERFFDPKLGYSPKKCQTQTRNRSSGRCRKTPCRSGKIRDVTSGRCRSKKASGRKRKSPKRKSPKRKSPKRKSPKRKSPKRK